MTKRLTPNAISASAEAFNDSGYQTYAAPPVSDSAAAIFWP